MRDQIAIVGGGPAGSRAAYALALRGVPVTIFDASHPREKPCGGGVTGRALALVADAIDPASFPNTVIRSARFTQTPARGVGVRGRSWGPESSVGVELAGDALVVASRTSFDAAMLAAAERAGARLVRSRVTDLSVDPAGVILTTADGGSHAASYLVGADGANSLVRRRVAKIGRAHV